MTTAGAPVLLTLGAKGATNTILASNIQSQWIYYPNSAQVIPFATANSVSDSGQLTSYLNQNSAVWQWAHSTSSTSNKNLAMKLHANHDLQIYAPSAGTDLILTPSAAGLSIIPSNLQVDGNFTVSSPSLATFNGNVTFNGIDNTMPAQQMTGTSSILTRGLADGLYLQSTTTTLGGADYAMPNQTLSAGGNAVLTKSLADGQYLATIPFDLTGSSYVMPNQTLSGQATVLTKVIADNLYLSASTTDCRLPQQTLAAPSSILTRQLADTVYVASQAPSVVLAAEASCAQGAQSAVLGGNNNCATGNNSVVIGGGNDVGQINTASGVGAAIIGAKSTSVVTKNSIIVGGSLNKIQSTQALAYEFMILGGHGNTIYPGVEGAGSAIIGATASGIFDGPGAYNLLVGGFSNKMYQPDHFQAIIGGFSNAITSSRYSVVIGGTSNKINARDAALSASINPANVILGGHTNTTGSLAQRAVIIGGQGNTANGIASAVVGSVSASSSGESSVAIASIASAATGKCALVQGEGSQAGGDHQVVTGKYNSADSTQALVIGNGASNSARSNAATVDWAGNAKFSGQVEGTSAKFTGPVEASAVSITGTVRVAARGGVSMGTFTAGQQP